MRVSATEAKNRFGALCQQAKVEAVIVEKAGQPDTVLLSYAEFQRLARPDSASMRLRRRQFGEQYREWIDAINRHHDQHGVWSDELRAW